VLSVAVEAMFGQVLGRLGQAHEDDYRPRLVRPRLATANTRRDVPRPVQS
jgi:hypothetical protein